MADVRTFRIIPEDGCPINYEDIDGKLTAAWDMWKATRQRSHAEFLAWLNVLDVAEQLADLTGEDSVNDVEPMNWDTNQN